MSSHPASPANHSQLEQNDDAANQLEPQSRIGTPRVSRSAPAVSVPHDCFRGAPYMNSDMLQVPMDAFQQHYAPFSPTDGDVEMCYDNLLNKGDIILDGGKPSWAAFQYPPYDGNSVETVGFQPLVDICDHIMEVRINNRQPRCRFMKNSSNKTVSEIEGSSHKIDGYFALKASTLPEWDGTEVPIVDIVMNAEFKKSDHPQQVTNNRRQCFAAAYHNMNEDICKGHTYSMTVENEQMSFWYWSRSHSVKSESFNFRTDLKRTIRGLMSFIFATMEELGYVSDIQRRVDPETKHLCLVFDVDGRYFKTVKVLAEHHDIVITGRATRAYEVIEVPSFDDLNSKDGPHLVLRYAWLEHDQPTERQIQNNIFEKLEAFFNARRAKTPVPHFDTLDSKLQNLIISLDKQQYRRYFLSIDCDEIGRKSKARHAMAIPVKYLFNDPDAPQAPSAVAHGDSRRSHPLPYHIAHSQNAGEVPRQLNEKQQYFVVYEEVCAPLHNIPVFRDVVRLLQDAFIAVLLLFIAGLVHRDLNSGNLLWHEESKRGILGDLEYTTVFDAPSSRSGDPKLGTAFFMAVEVHRQQPLTLPMQSRPADLELEGDDVEPSDVAYSMPVIHSFQHDLESIFWILVWTLIARVKISALQEYAKDIYQNTPICPQERYIFFTSNETLVKELRDRDPHKKIRPLIRAIEHLRIKMVQRYHDEGSNVKELKAYCQIFYHVYATLAYIVELEMLESTSELNDLETYSMIEDKVHLPPAAHKRRKNDDKEDYRPPSDDDSDSEEDGSKDTRKRKLTNKGQGSSPKKARR